MSKNVKLVVYVPASHSDAVRDAMGRAGAGHLGNYSHCSFTTRGTGRFKGNENSNPAIGEKGVLEQVEEERIEMTVSREMLKDVISAMKTAHLYEEIAYDIYPIEDR